MPNGGLAGGPTVFRGEWFVCSRQPFGGGLQTNRALLFDSVHPAPFHDLARTFRSLVRWPRITRSPRLFRVDPRTSGTERITGYR